MPAFDAYSSHNLWRWWMNKGNHSPSFMCNFKYFKWSTVICKISAFSNFADPYNNRQELYDYIRVIDNKYRLQSINFYYSELYRQITCLVLYLNDLYF